MIYNIDEIYYYGDHKVQLKAIWYEKGDTWAAFVYADPTSYSYGRQDLARLTVLTSKRSYKKKLQIQVKLKNDNTLDVLFGVHQQPPEEQKVLLNTTVEVELT
jgi:hypothetical protein